MKQFDKIFREKAVKAFDSFNADHLADAGWNSYAKKYRRKSGFALWLPLWAKAASVIILISAGTFLTYRAFYREIGSISPDIVKFEQPNVESGGAGTKGFTPEKGISTIADAGKIEVGETKAEDTKEPELPGVPDIRIADASTHDLQVSGQPDSLRIPDQSILPSITGRFIESNILADVLPQEVTEIELTISDPEEEITTKLRKTTLMAGFSGMMAGVKDAISSAPGVALGFYIDHELTRRISVRPGLAFTRNTYGLQSTESIPSLASYSTPEIDGLRATMESYEANMDVIAMELPLNFVFKIWERGKSSFFVSSGASTVIYLDQKFNGSFRNSYTKTITNSVSGEISFQTDYTVVDVESEHEAFSHVDYFGLANLSAGYSLPFGKNGSLYVEPFVQMPLSDLTSLNMRIRYGGLSMKLKF
jgi:hypothetical protein